MEIFESSKLVLFIIFAIPSFISIKTYSLLCPNHEKDSTKLIIDAITDSYLNYIITFYNRNKGVMLKSDFIFIRDSLEKYLDHVRDLDTNNFEEIDQLKLLFIKLDHHIDRLR